MIIRERESGYIDDLRPIYTDETVLLRVTAYDRHTRKPCYGTVIAFNKSRFVITGIYDKYFQGRSSSDELAMFIFQGSAHINGNR